MLALLLICRSFGADAPFAFILHLNCQVFAVRLSVMMFEFRSWTTNRIVRTVPEKLLMSLKLRSRFYDKTVTAQWNDHSEIAGAGLHLSNHDRHHYIMAYLFPSHPSLVISVRFHVVIPSWNGSALGNLRDTLDLVH